MRQSLAPGSASRSRRPSGAALAAAAEAVEVMTLLAARGGSVVTAVTGDARPPRVWAHYPDGDARDPQAGYRYFYHCHEPARRGEHGHFHVFSEAPAGEPGARPALTHLIAIGVDARGQPLRAFTVNRWVTDDCWQPAPQVLRRLRRFAMRTGAALEPVTRWLAAILELFAAPIRALVLARDARIAALRAGGRRPGLQEDRRIEVLSQCRLSLPARIAALGAPA